MIGLAILITLGLFFGPLILAMSATTRVGKLRSELDALSRRLANLERPQAPAAPTEAPPIAPPIERVKAVVPPAPVPLPAPKPATAAINWESILGVKFFAWIGGFAFFLGVVFFVKYAFERNLVTPLMRVTIGSIVGLLLVAAGALSSTRRYRAPAQSLCATGVLVLYANIYAAHAFYGLITLTSASALMCAVTAGALLLATRLDAQSVAWLAIIGGFVTPGCFWARQIHPASLFGYIAMLNFGVAAIAAVKRWNYLILLAAIGTVITEIMWVDGFFDAGTAPVTRVILIAFEAQFLAVCAFRTLVRPGERWSVSATALLGFTALIFCSAAIIDQTKYSADFVYPILLFGNAGIIALAALRRASTKERLLPGIVFVALAFTWMAEWIWHGTMFGSADPIFGVGWYVAIYLMFAAAPYFCGADRLWPFAIASAAGPLQFWFVYRLLAERFPSGWLFLLPLAFAIPATLSLITLVRRERLELASGDNRLAVQAASVLFFISLVFPVQFEREWIAVGWAIEGVALVFLFRVIPNPRLRAAALIVFCAAFARLALNPAVLEYHRRAAVPLWNWYLYAYGVTAVSLFIGARAFTAPRRTRYERFGPPLLATLGTVLCFLLLNIEIADYFSIGPTLTFSFSGDFARDMTYTISWALFALALLLIGIWRTARAIRLAAIALLAVALAKLFLHDLDQLNQLYRIAAFLSVALIAIVASFLYQRFLTRPAKGS